MKIPNPHRHLPGLFLGFLPIVVSVLHSARKSAKLELSSIEISILFSNGFWIYATRPKLRQHKTPIPIFTSMHAVQLLN